MSYSNKKILIGSIIHLNSGGEYLDTMEWVKLIPEFWNVSGTERVFVTTNKNKDRDRGSGSWKIISATGAADGTPLKVGDTIHLLNIYPDAGYLDCCGWIEHLPPYDEFKKDVTCGVFTSGMPDRDNGTGKWTVESTTKVKGQELIDEDEIRLINKYPGTGYLVKHGSVDESRAKKPLFNRFAGQSSFIFTNNKANSADPSSIWTIEAKATGDDGGILLFDYFGPELLKGRAHNMKGVVNMTNITLNDAFQAVGGISIDKVGEQFNETGVESLLKDAKSKRNPASPDDIIDHEFQMKQLFNLFALSRILINFDQNTLQKLMLESLTTHRENKTLPPLHLIRDCFRHTAADHEIIQRATVQRRWNQDKAKGNYFQSEQAVELMMMDKLAMKALKPFQTLLGSSSDTLAVITYFSETTHIRRVPYTDRFILVGVSYDRVSLAEEFGDDSVDPTLTGRDFSAFELMAIPHEVAHYIYHHGRLADGRTFPEVSEKFKENPYFSWCEEIFADLYGCIVAGPLSVFSIQAFLTSGDRSRAWKDDEEHPTPMLRSYILSKILEALKARKKTASTKYDFSQTVKILNKEWTDILEKWGFEGVEKSQPRPSRIYLPDDNSKYLERIVNVDRVLTKLEPLIEEFADLLLDAAVFYPLKPDGTPAAKSHIPWSQQDSNKRQDYAREMATLAGWETASEAVPIEVLLDIKPMEDRFVQEALKTETLANETEADKKLRLYLEHWGERGPHGWGGH